MGHEGLALLLAGWQGIFTDFGLESVEKRIKETHFISIFSPYFNCYYLHPVLIYSELFWRLSASRPDDAVQFKSSKEYILI